MIWLYRGVRVVLLLTCIWLAFDPLFGPRRLLIQRMNVTLPLLTLDYLVALGVGFLAGILLQIKPGSNLIFARTSSSNWRNG